MKQATKWIAYVLLVAMLLPLMPGALAEQSEGYDESEIIELELFTFWGPPADIYEDNPIGKVIEQKTGVRLIPAGVTGGVDYIQKMNLMFASNETPDFCTAPYWGGTDISTLTIKKAAKEGLVLPLDELVAQYGENLSLNEGMAKDFLQLDIEDPGFNGNHYLIPHHFYDKEDVFLWMYAPFARKDVLDAIGVKPEEITTSEKLYEVCKMIKDQKITDFNGNPIIPAGTFDGGWAAEMYALSYKRMEFGNLTKVDGAYTLKLFDPITDNYALFMRKMVADGLLDAECFTQTREMADQKVKNGSYAFIAAHYPAVFEAYDKYLKGEHPEAVYVPIGPIINADGKPLAGDGRQLNGMAGVGAFFLPKGCTNPEAVIRVLNYVNSEEGSRLVLYGIEGEHYTMVDGQPRATEKLLDLQENNIDEMHKLGIRRFYSDLVVNDWRMSKFGEFNIGESSKSNEYYDKFKEMYTYEYVDGFRADYLGHDYADINRINTLLPLAGDAVLKATFASSDEEALKILNDTRKQLMDNGLQDYLDHVNEKAAEREDIIY